jgi:hypothetical protein
VMTMEIVAEYRGIETDVGVWQYFRDHWQEWFPALKSRTTFVQTSYQSVAVQSHAARKTCLSVRCFRR